VEFLIPQRQGIEGKACVATKTQGYMHYSFVIIRKYSFVFRIAQFRWHEASAATLCWYTSE